MQLCNQGLYCFDPKECRVNQYNPNLLEAWNGNIDVQYVVVAYSCIAYIVASISNKASEQGELLKATQHEPCGNVGAVAELRKIGRVYLTHREESSMKAVCMEGDRHEARALQQRCQVGAFW